MAQIFDILVAIVLLAEPVRQPVQVVDTGELMDIFLKPAYAELQPAMAKPPADRKEWATIYQKAVRLAELDNLLFFRTHEDARKPDWGGTAARARRRPPMSPRRRCGGCGP